jgi:hypothetical protein
VDDLHYCTSGVQWKLECLGFETVETESGPLIPGDRHIQASPWCGDQTDDELLDLLPKIKALVILLFRLMPVSRPAARVKFGIDPTSYPIAFGGTLSFAGGKRVY